jgi:hypothetical protein
MLSLVFSLTGSASREAPVWLPLLLNQQDICRHKLLQVRLKLRHCKVQTTKNNGCVLAAQALTASRAAAAASARFSIVNQLPAFSRTDGWCAAGGAGAGTMAGSMKVAAMVAAITASSERHT